MFDLQNFAPLSGQANSNAPRLFTYATTDSIATVEGVDYFDTIVMETGDLVYITASDGELMSVYDGSSVSVLQGNPETTHATIWKDLVAPFSSAKGNGTTEPTWADMGNGIYAYKFTAGDELFVVYHSLHDYKRGTDAYPHVHFLVDATMTVGQQITWTVSYVIAKGHAQGGSLTAATTSFAMVYTATGTEVAGDHIVLECSEAQAFDLIEPDAIVMCSYEMTSENVTGNIFGIQGDLHYQADRDGTVNKAPDFYM